MADHAPSRRADARPAGNGRGRRAPVLGGGLRRQRLRAGVRLHRPADRLHLVDRDAGFGGRPEPAGDCAAGGEAGRPPTGQPGHAARLGAAPPAHRGALDVRGGWKQAGAHFAQAQTADPEQPALSRANLEALRGVAELRRGEIENCVACCNESSCIVPLAAAAIHRQPSGSRAAIEHFTRYLRQRPEDLGAKWLLNVAYMTLGEYPDRVPGEFLLPLGRLAPPAGESPLRMTNVAARAGLNRRGESMAGACLVDDFDGDGRVDVFMPTTDATKGAALLRNKGDGTFVDVSTAAGLDDQGLALNAVPRRLRQRRRPRHPDPPGCLGIPPADVAPAEPRRRDLRRRNPRRPPRRPDRHPGGRLGRLRQRRPTSTSTSPPSSRATPPTSGTGAASTTTTATGPSPRSARPPG